MATKILGKIWQANTTRTNATITNNNKFMLEDHFDLTETPYKLSQPENDDVGTNVSGDEEHTLYAFRFQQEVAGQLCGGSAGWPSFLFFRQVNEICLDMGHPSLSFSFSQQLIEMYLVIKRMVFGSENTSSKR
jgi:hypothetical protein